MTKPLKIDRPQDWYNKTLCHFTLMAKFENCDWPKWKADKIKKEGNKPKKNK